jgi:glutaredoxin
MAKEFLDNKNERYYEVDDRFTVVTVLKKYGFKTVPQIFYYNGPDEKLPGIIGGYNELIEWYSKNVDNTSGDSPRFPKESNRPS